MKHKLNINFAYSTEIHEPNDWTIILATKSSRCTENQQNT
jgi:hypothetical protein